MLKHLTQFTNFDFESFARGKTFEVKELREYIDFETKSHLGTKVTVVITEDQTKYPNQEGKDTTTNKYEQIVFKIKKDVDLPLGTIIVPKGVVAKVYGEYQNMLSVTCDDITVYHKDKNHDAH